MKTSLLRKQLSLLPIINSKDLNVYIRGMKLQTVCDITNENYREISSKPKDQIKTGTKLFMNYKDACLTYQEIHLVLDHIKDKVTNNQLDKEYLKDLGKQALYISKFCRCICTISQLKRFHMQKHPIKARLERIKLIL